MGLVERPWSTERRGNPPLFYFISVVLHDQDDDIAERIAGLEDRAAQQGYPEHAIHTGPLIRREGVYKNNTVEERKHLFNVLYYFSIHLAIKYFCVKVNKSECTDDVQQNAKLSKLISMEIQNQYLFWRRFDKIIVYYDNGQTQVTRIITSVFNTLFANVEMRKVRPVDYKLFQVADLICTLEMIHDKAKHNGLSKSESVFFNSIRSFKKDYYRKISCKRI